MKFCLPAILLLAACGASDDPPRGAIEVELAVTAVMGAFDPEKGASISSELYVVIEGEQYALRLDDDAKVVGEASAAPMFVGGKRVIVAGEVQDNEYHAHYFKWLPDGDDEPEPTVTLGLPRAE